MVTRGYRRNLSPNPKPCADTFYLGHRPRPAFIAEDSPKPTDQVLDAASGLGLGFRVYGAPIGLSGAPGLKITFT